MDDEIETWYVIQWLDTPSNPNIEPFMQQPTLCQKESRRDGDRLIWPNGSWFVWPENAEIIHTYHVGPNDDPWRFFYRDYPPAPGGEAVHSGGWIAPNGKFYPCSYHCHGDLADALAWTYYDSDRNTRELEERNWLRVSEAGAVHLYGVNRVTQAQIDMLYDLSVLEDAPREWKQYLEGAMHHVEDFVV